jgi:hypothetical protein
MPERQIGLAKLRIGAHVTGWLLTCWALTLAVLSFTTYTVVGDALLELGTPRWVMPAVLIGVAAVQLCGHVTQSGPILIQADLFGAVVCMTAASIAAYAALHGDNASISAANWALIGCIFLIHASVLKTNTRQ